VRNIGAFLLLGQKERSHELLNFFLKDQRPPGWNHWAEVVWRNPQEPKLIGDKPHTWVGSDFFRAIRNMFVYERESDSMLVFGAGILEAWLNQPAGIEVRGLATHYGTVSYSMKKSGQSLAVNIWGKMHFPEGKIILKSPRAGGIKSVQINGKSSNMFKPDEVQIDEFPTNMILYY